MTKSYRDSRTLTLLREFHRAYRSVQCVDSDGIEAMGMLQSEFDVIATLGNTEGMPMGQMATRMLTSPGNVTRLVKRLEGRGLVRRARAPWSDRVVIATLTAEGEALFDRTYPAQYEHLKAWFDGRLTTEQQEQLTTLLQALQPESPCDSGTE